MEVCSEVCSRWHILQSLYYNVVHFCNFHMWSYKYFRKILPNILQMKEQLIKQDEYVKRKCCRQWPIPRWPRSRGQISWHSRKILSQEMHFWNIKSCSTHCWKVINKDTFLIKKAKLKGQGHKKMLVPRESNCQ